MNKHRWLAIFAYFLVVAALAGAYLTVANNYLSSNSSSSTPSNNTPPSFDSSSTPPSQPNSTTNSDTSTSQPTPPSDSSGSTPPEFSATTTSTELSNLSIGILLGCAIVFTISLMYIIFSRSGKRTLSESLPSTGKKILFTVINLIVIAGLVVASVWLLNKYLFSSNSNPNINTQMGSNSANIDTAAAFEFDGISTEETDKNYSTDVADTSVILVDNGGKVTLNNVTIDKSGGDTTSTENSDFYGLNAAVLAKNTSTLTINGGTITTNAQGANAVFSTGEGSTINLYNLKINTSQNSSRGLDATYGGTIIADKVTISTLGAHSASLATDRGEGTVTVSNATLSTAGEGSPLVYSTGNITLSDSSGTSIGSSIAVIEGKNSVTVSNSDLIGYAIGRATGGIDNTGVMIYQSTSGDAAEGEGTFTATDSYLTIASESSVYTSAPMFFITNTDATINLKNTTLSFGSGILLNSAGNTGEWGNAGSNGGNVTFNAENQTCSGNITADNISTVVINLKSGSSLTSTINSDNSAKSITINLSNDSTWNVTGDSYITILSDDTTDLSNINDNGYNIYYDSSNSNNSWLNGKTYDLQNGGQLLPV